jgi:hypothetical protein
LHAECIYAECHYAECHYAECHYAECHYAECHYAECRYSECPNAERPYPECRGTASILILFLMRPTILLTAKLEHPKPYLLCSQILCPAR